MFAMRFLIKCFLLTFLINFTRSALIPRDDTELVLVSVIFRHGARTTYSFYPTDPNKNASFYPVGYGGLTNEGKLGEYKLGLYLKELYGGFLGDVYVEDEVSVRSTDVTRTKMSAQLVLAGLFPPSSIQQWNQDLLWQPIPVSYKTEAEEDIFHPWGTCPYKKRVIDELPSIKEVQETYIDPYTSYFSLIQNYSGKSMNTPADMQDIYFIFKTEGDMGLIMPEWTEQIYPEPCQSIAATVYGYHNYDSRVKQINSGYMLTKILDDSKKKIEGDSSKKIYLYSGHESTMGYMLNALDVYKVEVPQYGSALSFEIHKSGEDYFVKLRYRTGPEATDALDLAVPGCDLLCPYDKFVELQKDLIPDISIQDACKDDKERSL